MPGGGVIGLFLGFSVAWGVDDDAFLAGDDDAFLAGDDAETPPGATVFLDGGVVVDFCVDVLAGGSLPKMLREANEDSLRVNTAMTMQRVKNRPPKIPVMVVRGLRPERAVNMPALWPPPPPASSPFCKKITPIIIKVTIKWRTSRKIRSISIAFCFSYPKGHQAVCKAYARFVPRD
jgi:hypothetical protein